MQIWNINYNWLCNISFPLLLMLLVQGYCLMVNYVHVSCFACKYTCISPSEYITFGNSACCAFTHTCKVNQAYCQVLAGVNVY